MSFNITPSFPCRFLYCTKIYACKKNADIFPEKMNRALFTIGGDVSIEAALKVAILNRPKAHNFISLYGAYHGTSFMTTGGRYYGKRQISSLRIIEII